MRDTHTQGCVLVQKFVHLLMHLSQKSPGTVVPPAASLDTPGVPIGDIRIFDPQKLHLPMGSWTDAHAAWLQRDSTGSNVSGLGL